MAIRPRWFRDMLTVLGGLAGIGAVTAGLLRCRMSARRRLRWPCCSSCWPPRHLARLWTAIVVSILAMLALNFFFLPPLGTLTIADPQNWIALFAFLVVAVIASNLSAAAQERAREAIARPQRSDAALRS